MSARKTVVITGASSGIGLELAKLFARDGYCVVATGREAERLEATCAALRAGSGATAHAIAMDLADADGPRRFVEQVDALGLTVDVLVNSAAFGQVGAFAKLGLERQLAMMDLDMRALVELTHRFLPGMLERRSGHILNLGSTAAFLPGPGMAVYFASKAFVVSFSQALAHELLGSGVTATVVCPGPTATGFAASAGSDRLALYQGALANAADVAQHCYAAMLRGEALSFHGKRTSLRVNLLKLAPLSVATRFGARATRPVT